MKRESQLSKKTIIEVLNEPPGYIDCPTSICNSCNYRCCEVCKNAVRLGTVCAYFGGSVDMIDMVHNIQRLVNCYRNSTPNNKED